MRCATILACFFWLPRTAISRARGVELRHSELISAWRAVKTFAPSYRSLSRVKPYADLATLCFRTAAGFGGSTLATREGATTRLLITVLTPSTEPRAIRRQGARSVILYLPFRVATPLATLTWMF